MILLFFSIYDIIIFSIYDIIIIYRKNSKNKMAKADQKVTSPQPVWIFLWSFGLLVVCFLALHHWHHKLKTATKIKYAPTTQTYKLSDITKAKTSQQLRTLEGGEALANIPS